MVTVIPVKGNVWNLSAPWDEEQLLSSARQVSWLPDHRLARAFPSLPDSGVSERLTGYSGASATDFHRFPYSHSFSEHAGLVGLNFGPILATPALDVNRAGSRRRAFQLFPPPQGGGLGWG